MSVLSKIIALFFGSTTGSQHEQWLQDTAHAVEDSRRISSEKDLAIIAFMELVLEESHPNIDEYPIEELREVERKEGADSKSIHRYAYYIVQAYRMRKYIDIVKAHSNCS